MNEVVGPKGMETWKPREFLTRWQPHDIPPGRPRAYWPRRPAGLNTRSGKLWLWAPFGQLFIWGRQT